MVVYYVLILLIFFVFFIVFMIKQKKENNDREEELEQEQVWNRIKHILSDFTIAGTYYRTQEEIFCAENLQIGEELVLEKEPTNELRCLLKMVIILDIFQKNYAGCLMIF